MYYVFRTLEQSLSADSPAIGSDAKKHKALFRPAVRDTLDAMPELGTSCTRKRGVPNSRL